MGFISSSNLALFFIERYKSIWDHGHPGVKAEVGAEDFELQYALMQIRNKVVNGIEIDLLKKKVLEIGCGHGGICVYAAMNGASEVVGIDLSDDALAMAAKVKAKFETEDLVRRDIVSFKYSGAEKIDYPDEYFDVIIADNVLEHVSDIEGVLRECNRLLKHGGAVLIPNFPSIYSKFGPHLKYGSKIPWLHIFFTEKAICEAVYKRAVKYPALGLFDYYGGLKDNPKTFREVRKYKDLSYITNLKFKKAYQNSGLTLTSMYVSRPLAGRLLFKLMPFLSHTRLDDIFSTGTKAILKKK